MDQFDLVFKMYDDPEPTVLPQDGDVLVTTLGNAEDILGVRTDPARSLLNLGGLPSPGLEHSRKPEREWDRYISSSNGINLVNMELNGPKLMAIRNDWSGKQHADGESNEPGAQTHPQTTGFDSASGVNGSFAVPHEDTMKYLNQSQASI